MGERADVRSDGEGHSSSNLFFELTNLVFEHLGFSGGLILRFSMMREIVKDGKGRNSEDALVAREAHGFVAQLGGVVDGGDSGLRRVERSRLAHCMHANDGA